MPLDNRTDARVKVPNDGGNRQSAPQIAPQAEGILRPPQPKDLREVQPRTITLDLATARVGVQFNVRGTSIKYATTTNPVTDVVQVALSRLGADAIPMKEGDSYQGIPFDGIFITNAAIAGATAVLVIFHEYPDQQFRIG